MCPEEARDRPGPGPRGARRAEGHLSVPAGTVGIAVVEADTPHDDCPILIGPSSFLTGAIAAAKAKAVAPPAAPGRPALEAAPEGEPAGAEDEHVPDEASRAGPDSPDVAQAVKFVFPAPCAMDGVKSRKKVIFKMSNVSFAYPASGCFSIVESNLEMSQASRILVAGAKGSGKSTLVKVLIGKLKLTEGAIQKAVGISVAYVSQHTFHQLEDRMHMTPLQYMMWRFAEGSDRESPELHKYQKPRLPTQGGIEQHCSDFGVDQVVVNRLHIKQLNQGMRFRLVLSAAMWLNPNLLVLDEPAGCLDHRSLEALAAAVRDYRGGVLVTSDSTDGHFFEGAATERYVLREGRLRPDARGGGDGTAAAAAEARCGAGACRGAARRRRSAVRPAPAV